MYKKLSVYIYTHIIYIYTYTYTCTYISVEPFAYNPQFNSRMEYAPFLALAFADVLDAENQRPPADRKEGDLTHPCTSLQVSFPEP